MTTYKFIHNIRRLQRNESQVRYYGARVLGDLLEIRLVLDNGN